MAIPRTTRYVSLRPMRLRMDDAYECKGRSQIGEARTTAQNRFSEAKPLLEKTTSGSKAWNAIKAGGAGAMAGAGLILLTGKTTSEHFTATVIASSAVFGIINAARSVAIDSEQNAKDMKVFLHSGAPIGIFVGAMTSFGMLGVITGAAVGITAVICNRIKQNKDQ